MTKKSGKSLKEKRADKRAKAGQISQTEALLHTKQRWATILSKSGSTVRARPRHPASMSSLVACGATEPENLTKYLNIKQSKISGISGALN
jgi:hypothetical protein